MTYWRLMPLAAFLVALISLAVVEPRQATAQDDGLNWLWQPGVTLHYQWSLTDRVQVSAVSGVRAAATHDAYHRVTLVLAYEVLSVREDTARLRMSVVTSYLDARPAVGEGYIYDSRTLRDYGRYFDSRMQPLPQLMDVSVVLEVDRRGNIRSVEGDVNPFATALDILNDRRRPLTRPERLGVGGMRQLVDAHHWIMPGYPTGNQSRGDTWERNIDLYGESGLYQGTLRNTYDGTHSFGGDQVARVSMSMPSEPVFNLEDDAIDMMEIRRIEVGGTILHGTLLGRLINATFEMQAVTRATLVPARADERHPRVYGVRLNRTVQVQLLTRRRVQEALTFDDSELPPQEVWQGVSAFRSGVMLQRDPSHEMVTRLANACTRFLETFAPSYAHLIGDGMPRRPDTEDLEPAEVESRLDRYLRQLDFYETLSSATDYLARLTELNDDEEYLKWIADHLQSASEIEGLPTRLRATLRAGKARAEVRLAKIRTLRAKFDSYQVAIATAKAALELEEMSDDTFRRLHQLNIFAHLQLGIHDELHTYMRASTMRMRGERRVMLLELHIDALVRGQQWQRIRSVSDDLYLISERRNQLSGQISALEGRAKAQIALTDRRVIETFDALYGMGREGRRAVNRIERFRRFLPMQRATEFHLPRLDGEGASQLRDYRGQHVAVIFYRAQHNPSADALRAFDGIVSRYDRAVLGATAIGYARGQREPLEALQTMQERVGGEFPTDWLWDRTGSVGRAYGVDRFPVVYLIDSAGRVVWADRVINVREQMHQLRDALERSLELAQDAPYLIHEDVNVENTPEYRLLEELFDFVGIPETHLARLGRTVSRRAELLGADGRLLMRSLLLLMIVEGDTRVDRRVLENLLESMVDKE